MQQGWPPRPRHDCALMRTVRNKRREESERERGAERRAGERHEARLLRYCEAIFIREHARLRLPQPLGLPSRRVPLAISSFSTGFLLISPQRCLACLCLFLFRLLILCERALPVPAPLSVRGLSGSSSSGAGLKNAKTAESQKKD